MIVFHRGFNTLLLLRMMIVSGGVFRTLDEAKQKIPSISVRIKQRVSYCLSLYNCLWGEVSAKLRFLK